MRYDLRVHPPTFRRARTPEAKQQRTAALISAARRLGLELGVRNVTLTEIATGAGVHISAVRRYFDSREEIFLRLTADCWRDWVAAVRDELRDRNRVTAEELALVLADTLAERPLFCDLLAHDALTFERESSHAAVRAFKLESLAAVADLVAAIRRVLPELDERSARDLVAAVRALTASLWQTAHPPAALTELYRTEPALGHEFLAFRPRLTRLIRATTLGLAAGSVDQARPSC